MFANVSGNSIASLAAVGLELSKEGRLSLNQSKFDAAIKENGFDALKALIGTAETGGVLKSITDSLSSLQKTSTPGTVSGILQESITGLMRSLRAEDERIAADRIASTIGQRISGASGRCRRADRPNGTAGDLHHQYVRVRAREPEIVLMTIVGANHRKLTRGRYPAVDPVRRRLRRSSAGLLP